MTDLTEVLTDLSNVPPMERSGLRDSELKGNPARRCKAHRKNGEQCRKWAIQGGNVCATHGGKARQVVAKAKLRLMENADPAVKQLLKIAFDDNEPTEIRLKATLAAIDRAGLGVKSEVEVGISVKPFEAILDKMDSGSRSEYRRSMGIEVDDEPQPALAQPPCEYDDGYGDDDLIVDGEVVDDVSSAPQAQENQGPGERTAPFCGPDGHPWAQAPNPFGGPLGPNGPAGSGMVPLADAVAAQAEMRKHATLRPIQRALPRGRS